MLRSRAGAWSAPRHHTCRTTSTGERFRSKLRLPGRSLLPSTTLECVAALRPSRTSDRSAHPYFRTDARDPPDLGADFPDAHQSLRPGGEAGFPLLGLSKDRPSIVQAVESDSRRPRHRVSAALQRAFEMGTPIPIRVPPSWFFATSTVFLLDPAAVFRQLPILGFTAFPPVAKQDFPRCTCRPSKPSLRRQRRAPGSLLSPVGSRHRFDRLRSPRSP